MILQQPCFILLEKTFQQLCQRFLRQRILLVSFFHDVDLTANLIELDFGFFAFGDHFVEVAVQQVHDFRETGGVAVGVGAFPGHFGPLELFAAVFAILAPGLPEFVFGSLSRIEVLPLDLVGISDHAAESTGNVVHVADLVSLQAADVNINGGVVRTGQAHERHVFGVAAEIPVFSSKGGVDGRIPLWRISSLAKAVTRL